MMKICTRENPFTFSECVERFIEKGALHAWQKPYCCFECRKTFTQDTRLERHERFHTGENVYLL